MTKELKPCPLCNSDNIQIWFEESGIPHMRLPLIVCNTCHLMLKGVNFVYELNYELNPDSDYTHEVIVKWNKRIDA